MLNISYLCWGETSSRDPSEGLQRSQEEDSDDQNVVLPGNSFQQLGRLLNVINMNRYLAT